MRLVRLTELLPPEYAPVTTKYKNKKKKKTLLRVELYNPEGEIPHVHLIKPGASRSGNIICVCLHADTYFHDDKRVSNDQLMRELNSGLREALMNYMSEKVDDPDKEEYGFDSRWAYLCSEWNRMNPNHRFRLPSSIPRYDKMQTSPEEADKILSKLRINNDSES